MDNIRIQTTQNVDIEYQVASVGDRLLASLLDVGFMIAYFVLVLAIIGMTSIVTKGHVLYIYFLFLLPILFYDLVCETLFGGRSIGKMIMKIKVVKLDGTPAGFGSYLLRWFFRIVDISLSSGAIALIVVVANGRGQRIGDIAAGTTVIKTKQRAQLGDTILGNVKQRPDYTVVFPEVTRLSDNDVAIIKEVMLVGIRTNNMPAIEKLASKTRSVMAISTPMPASQFLFTVVQDYNFYSFDR